MGFFAEAGELDTRSGCQMHYGGTVCHVVAQNLGTEDQIFLATMKMLNCYTGVDLHIHHTCYQDAWLRWHLAFRGACQKNSCHAEQVHGFWMPNSCKLECSICDTNPMEVCEPMRLCTRHCHTNKHTGCM